jgi:hypothetical protein
MTISYSSIPHQKNEKENRERDPFLIEFLLLLLLSIWWINVFVL